MTNTAVLVIDMMNTYDHPDAERLAPNVETIIDPLSKMVDRARSRDDVDLIYVNDNYGGFTAAPGDLVDDALNQKVRIHRLSVLAQNFVFKIYLPLVNFYKVDFVCNIAFLVTYRVQCNFFSTTAACCCGIPLW